MSVSSNRRRTLRISDVSKKAPNNDKVLRFNLPHNTRVKDILQNYVNATNIKEYEQLVCSIRDNVFNDSEIESLLVEAIECISILNRDLHLFVEAILVLKWAQKSELVIQKYKSFLVNLLCAHNYHSKFVLEQIISNFIPDKSDKEWTNGIPPDEDCNKLANIHSVIHILLKTIPMSWELLLQSIISLYPYFKKPTHSHEYYLHNVLWIFDYQPKFKLEFLQLIFNRLIVLDVNASKADINRAELAENNDDIFAMDDLKSVRSCAEPDRMKHPTAHTLDVCLDKMLHFVIAECYNLETGDLNWDRTKQLYQNLIIVFDKIVLPTYNIQHVQFVMFFLVSFKITLSEAFLGYLWKKVGDPNVASVHRQAAIAYVASLLARAAYIPLSMLKSTLEQISAWIHSYISNQDGLESVNSDVRVHAVFYSVCQALFYIIAFRHRDLVNTRKNITFLESLNLGKMVTCRLNPLRVCQAAIVQNFAAITRTYQLAYCYTVIEHNSRSSIPTVYMDDTGGITTSTAVLESFFPFDPYLLKRSGQKIAPLYLEYTEVEKDADIQEGNAEAMEEDDDFLKDNRFTYGASPGFKYKS